MVAPEGEKNNQVNVSAEQGGLENAPFNSAHRTEFAAPRTITESLERAPAELRKALRDGDWAAVHTYLNPQRGLNEFMHASTIFPTDSLRAAADHLRVTIDCLRAEKLILSDPVWLLVRNASRCEADPKRYPYPSSPPTLPIQEENRSLLRAVLEAEPMPAGKSTEFRFIYGLIQSELKDYKGALETFRELLLEMPKSSFAAFYVGFSLHALEQDQEATKYYLRTLNLNSDYTIAHNNLGRCYRRIGDLDRALDAFSAAYRLDPSSEVVRFDLVHTLTRIGCAKLDETTIRNLAQYRSSIAQRRDGPLKPEWEVVTGNALTSTNSARMKFEKALEIDSSFAPAQRNLSLAFTRIGWLHYERHEFGTAVKFLKRSLEIAGNPNKKGVSNFLATVFYEWALKEYDLRRYERARNGCEWALYYDRTREDARQFLRRVEDILARASAKRSTVPAPAEQNVEVKGSHAELDRTVAKILHEAYAEEHAREDSRKREEQAQRDKEEAEREKARRDADDLYLWHWTQNQQAAAAQQAAQDWQRHVDNNSKQY